MTSNNNPKYTMWEAWFTSSLIVLLLSIAAGTLENSRAIFPYWDIWMTAVCINFVIAVITGRREM